VVVFGPDAAHAGGGAAAGLPAADPASRTSYAAGELAQDDFWFPDIEILVGFGQVRTAKQLPVLTMLSGYSRWAGQVVILDRRGAGKSAPARSLGELTGLPVMRWTACPARRADTGRSRPVSS
jgi:hypothetical protein